MSMTSSSNFLDVAVFLLSNLVFFIAGSGISTIFVHKGLTRNPEIGNTLLLVLPNIWTPHLARMSLILNIHAENFQGYSFYRF